LGCAHATCQTGPVCLSGSKSVIRSGKAKFPLRTQSMTCRPFAYPLRQHRKPLRCGRRNTSPGVFRSSPAARHAIFCVLDSGKRQQQVDARSCPRARSQSAQTLRPRQTAEEI
jgi:hypothetical protein